MKSKINIKTKLFVNKKIGSKFKSRSIKLSFRIMFCIFAYRKKWTEDHTETQGPKRTKSQRTLKRTLKRALSVRTMIRTLETTLSLSTI